MSEHRLSNGREIYLVRLVVEPTYAGCLEGSPEQLSPRLLSRLPEHAARILTPAKPLAVIHPQQSPLPGWLWVAELGSPKGVHNTDPDFSSRLYACWFTDDTAKSIDSIVEAILPYLDWERLAEDFDIMDF